MPQPAEVERTALELIRLYEQAQADVAEQLQALANDPRATRKRQRLRELAASVGRQMTDLQAESRTWVEQKLPPVYQLGAEGAAVTLGEAFAWNQVHTQAVESLAAETWQDILGRTRYVADEAKRWAREQVSRQAARSVIQGVTPDQARRALVSSAGEVANLFGGPVGMVRYADGSLRRLDDWADSAIRTVTARAHNAGAVTMMREAQTSWCELVDGAGCGLRSHDDTVKAHGLIVPVADVGNYLISHPRCVRGIVPRPDVRSAAEAATAGPLVAEPEQGRPAAPPPATYRERRPARTPRSARTPRQPRTARSS